MNGLLSQAFFNSGAANLLQHIAVPLEGVGLILTLVEVLSPETARRIEEELDEIAKMDSDRAFLWSSVIIGIPAAAIGAIWLIRRVLEVQTRHSLIMSIITAIVIFGAILLLIMMSTLLIGMWTVLLGMPLKLLDSIFGGRALGGLGVCLAGCGFLLEIYQVITLHLAV